MFFLSTEFQSSISITCWILRLTPILSLFRGRSVSFCFCSRERNCYLYFLLFRQFKSVLKLRRTRTKVEDDHEEEEPLISCWSIIFPRLVISPWAKVEAGGGGDHRRQSHPDTSAKLNRTSQAAEWNAILYILTPHISVLTSTPCYRSAMSSFMLSPDICSMICTFFLLLFSNFQISFLHFESVSSI